MLRLGTNEAWSSSAKLLVIVLNPNLGPLRYSWDCSNNINIRYQVIKNIQALQCSNLFDESTYYLNSLTLNWKSMESLSPVSG